MSDPDQASAQTPEDRTQLLGFTPTALRAWFRAVPGWRSFDGAYLVAWGARFLPDLAVSRWWLWVTSGKHMFPPFTTQGTRQFACNEYLDKPASVPGALRPSCLDW